MNSEPNFQNNIFSKIKQKMLKPSPAPIYSHRQNETIG
jgi:hypothetical protein